MRGGKSGKCKNGNKKHTTEKKCGYYNCEWLVSGSIQLKFHGGTYEWKKNDVPVKLVSYKPMEEMTVQDVKEWAKESWYFYDPKKKAENKKWIAKKLGKLEKHQWDGKKL